MTAVPYSEGSQASHLPDAEHYAKLARMYLSAPTNEYYRPRMTISEGEAVLEIDVQKKLYHSAAAMHGSHYFKVLDDSAFFAVNSLVADVFVLTVSFTVHLLRPVSEGIVTGRGTVVHRSRRLFVAESVLTDSRGNEIARGNGTFMPSRTPLGPELGYE